MTRFFDYGDSRRLLLWLLLPGLCLAFSCIFIGIKSHQEERIELQIEHTHDVIRQSQALSNNIYALVSSQRGYLISGDPQFLENFQKTKEQAGEQILQLSKLVADNPAQQNRLQELRARFVNFSALLEKGALERKPQFNFQLSDLQTVVALRGQMVELTNTILNGEYALLDKRIREINAQKSLYSFLLLCGGFFFIVALTLLNAFLLKEIRQRTRSERSLGIAEDRFALVVQGTKDGIFDWEIDKNQVYFSPQYKAMLGYAEEEYTNELDEFNRHVHPDDKDYVWESVHSYLEGQHPDFNLIFRMRHKDGRWIWINARGNATFDSSGKPLRLIGSHSDITYLKEYEERLTMAKEEAEKANAAKSEFLAHMSHEIRTPLTAISGVGEILERQADTLTPRQKKLVNVLQDSTESLQDLIDDLLDFAKIESGQLTLDNEHFNLGQLFEQVISIMSDRAAEKNLVFSFDYDALGDTIFDGDRKRLRQVLINLIGNAIKFTDKGSVTVTALRRENGADDLIIEVRDTGIGIPKENLDKIFERFRQSDSSISRRFGGTGLGLSISRSLAALMGGTIDVQSTEGEGSAFTLIIPFRSAIPSKVAELVSIQQKHLLGQTRVLIVEDYEGNVTVLSHLLENAGYLYDVANNGHEAVQKQANNSYGLILMDIQMPVVDGYQATIQIRDREKRQNLPPVTIVGMTAHALPGDRERCLAVGMNDYMSKPISQQLFAAILAKYMPSGKQAA